MIAHELGVAVRATASVAGPKSVTLYAQADPSLLSPRAAVFLLIACLHALVIYALAVGLARRVFDDISTPITVLADKLDDARQPPPTLPPLRRFQPPEIENVEPQVRIDTPPDVDAIRVAGPGISELQVPPPPVVRRTLGGPGAGFPDTEGYYPAASRRIGETGVVTVRVCVDATGRLIGDPAVAQSSGSVRLDEGALKLARAGSGHYRATTEDGRAVSSCYPYRIRFELRN